MRTNRHESGLKMVRDDMKMREVVTTDRKMISVPDVMEKHSNWQAYRRCQAKLSVIGLLVVSHANGGRADSDLGVPIDERDGPTVERGALVRLLAYRAGSPLRTLSRKAFHSVAVKRRIGPCGSLLSLTWMRVSCGAATSRQLPLP